jgi:hypothetical protein
LLVSAHKHVLTAQNNKFRVIANFHPRYLKALSFYYHRPKSHHNARPRPKLFKLLVSRDKLLDFYDELPIAKEYRGVDRDEFKELFTKTKGKLAKRVKKRPVTFEETYLPTGEPPVPPLVARSQYTRAVMTTMMRESLARFWFDSDCYWMKQSPCRSIFSLTVEIWVVSGQR